MKSLKFHRAIVAIAMMLIGWLPSLAHDFEVDGIYYDKINSSTVEVTYKGSSHYEYDDDYNGSVVIPSLVEYGGFTYSVTSIGEWAFYYCSSLTSIEIPYSVTSIGELAFDNCYDLTSIEIPNSVTSIGEGAFWGCYSLTSVEIPNSVTSIGYAAFNECSSLTSIVVDSGNTEYDSRNGCNAIIETASNTLIAGCQNTIIPNSVTSIGNYAFYGCYDLTGIEIPNSVTSIGDQAFRYCSGLISIEIPNSVTSIGWGAFYGCTSLTSVEIPNSVTSIGGSAFRDCESLTSIEIPNSVTSIGDAVFAYCESLTSIEIPNSVKSIGDYEFYGCYRLGDVVIGNSVTTIGECAFSCCTRLTRVEIGNSVTSIGDRAFEHCPSLTKITCHATTPPTIHYDTFSNYSADLYVPVGCKSAYQSANYWKNFNIINDTLDNPITLNDNDAIVATIGDNIVVKNATVGSVVRVYTTDGAMIASEVATEGDVIIEAPVKGIYIVKVGKQTVKVII